MDQQLGFSWSNFRWTRISWRSLVGLSISVFSALLHALEVGEHIDFINSHQADPGLVGDALKFVGNLPSYWLLGLVATGVILIAWDGKRIMSTSEDSRVPTGGAGGAGAAGPFGPGQPGSPPVGPGGGGGGGSGGPESGGGGGGGGENANGGNGGNPGGGGGGGGKNGAGGHGGNAMIKLHYQGNPHTPTSLLELYDSDSSSTGVYSMIPVMLSTNDGPEYRVETRLAFSRNSLTNELWLYFPDHKEPEHVIDFMLGRITIIFSDLSQISDKLNFSGRVFVYFESILPPDARMRLLKGIDRPINHLEIRDAKYFDNYIPWEREGKSKTVYLLVASIEQRKINSETTTG